MCFFTTSSFSQNIKWEKNYSTALKDAQENNKLLLIYFNDGKSPSIERLIKKRIFKSNEFKNISDNIVGLLITEVENNNEHRYNSRVVSGYNSNKVFPSVKVMDFKSKEHLPLLTNFEEANIKLFFSQLKNLLY